MNPDPMNMSLTDQDLREKIAATINEADLDFLRKRGNSPREFADALSWEMANCGMVTFEEYKQTVYRLCQTLQNELFELRQMRLDGEKVEPQHVVARGMLRLSRERAEAIRQLQWAMREWPKWRGEESPRYRQAMRFLESLGDEDKPCHICKAKPGEQGGEFCSKCACVNCTWKEGRIVEFCPEHQHHEGSQECGNCGVFFNSTWQTKCPACGWGGGDD